MHRVRFKIVNKNNFKIAEIEKNRFVKTNLIRIFFYACLKSLSEEDPRSLYLYSHTAEFDL